MTCPECHGDTTDGNGDLCARCRGTGELEPAGESVAARAARERRLQGAAPSEVDLRPTERKLTCGCFVERVGDTWRVTGQAFLCPEKHAFYAALAPEIVTAKGVSEPGSPRKAETVSPVPDGIVEGVGTGTGSLTSLQGGPWPGGAEAGDD